MPSRYFANAAIVDGQLYGPSVLTLDGRRCSVSAFTGETAGTVAAQGVVVVAHRRLSLTPRADGEGFEQFLKRLLAEVAAQEKGTAQGGTLYAYDTSFRVAEL